MGILADEPRPQDDKSRPPRIRNIAELAKLAGVSAGTVSRALAGKDLVNAETRERIQAIARQHGFRPNQMARRLRNQHTGVIGVIIPLGHERRQLISDPFFMSMFAHLADAVTQSGQDIMLSRIVPDDPEWLDRIVDSGMLDGALMIGQSDQFDAIERVAERYQPLVVWGTHRAGQRHCSVGTDNVLGGQLAARHLMERGARRLAFFGDTTGPEIADRLTGAQQVVADSSASLVACAIALAEQEMAAHIEQALDQFAGTIDGIFCASDLIANTTIRILTDRGVSIPADVAVVGYDDLPIALHTAPQLTTIRQPIAVGAGTMVEGLLRRIAGEDTPSTIMPPELVIRASS